MAIKLSILDQSPIGEGETAEQALRHTVRFAQVAEALGYHRFWVSEHHNSTLLAGSAPEALMAYLLAKTEKIKIGSGGVMLQHYSPYKVAEVFHLLSALAPGRVDLGVGKAPGGLNASTQALQIDKQLKQKSFDQKIESLQAFILASEESEELKATPISVEKPDLFLLGGSVESAELAAKLRISFVFAYFINGDKKVLEKARERYREASPENSAGQFILAVTVAVAEREEQAIAHIKQKETVKVIFSDGKKVNVNSLEQAEKHIEQSDKKDYQIIVQQAGYVAGSPEKVRRELEDLAKPNDISEIILLTPIVDIEERIHAIKLLNEAFQLEVNKA